MKPRLIFSPVTGRVYVITRYRVSVGPDGQELVEPIGDSKHDVTEDFDRTTLERAAVMFPTTRLKRLGRPK